MDNIVCQILKCKCRTQKHKIIPKYIVTKTEMILNGLFIFLSRLYRVAIYFKYN